MLQLVLGVLLSTPPPHPMNSGPLRTIVTEHSSPACQAFRERIAPAVRAVLLDDRLVEHSDAIFINAAHDDSLDTPSHPKVGLEMMRLEMPEDAIAHNIITIETLLDDPRLAQAHSRTDRSVAALKAHLERVLRMQKSELNAISGQVETNALETLRAAPDPAGAAAGGTDRQPHQSLAPVLPPFYGAPKLPSNEVARAMGRLTDFDLNDPYFHTAQALASGVRAEQPEEHRAAALLITVADSCR